MSKKMAVRKVRAYLSDIFSRLSSTFDLLLVSGSSNECFSHFFRLEVVNVCSDTKSLYSIGVEMLISEEWPDDSRETG